MSTLEDRMVGVETLVSSFDERLKHMEGRDGKAADKAQTAVNIAQKARAEAQQPRPRKLFVVGVIVGILGTVALAKVLLLVHFW